ncbi:signal peptidase I [Pseudarthrobacter sp. AL07]|uniref:signal peptidase I n=1 Tax=unclassified Pseudarthrobacter TaxID=2647000 RepID=UPI00249BEF03|nr:MULTISPECIES: signal peptidase I [unclassified Pseudarthrobacter]MDI3193570.1 signal peptidase I [Pseudarthrobacter sp. AL20]MDI3207920.1 signal peptidase I [Pseudarthrobacter sp. AL07]
MSTATDLLGGPGVAHTSPASRRRMPPGWGAGASTGAPKASRFKAAARKTGSALTTAMLVIALAAFLFLAVGPRVFGYHTSTMLTGSMAPLINPGDVVVTAPVPASDIKVGDVITYLIPVEDHRVETHRVTEVLTNADGTTAVRTKGDANNGVDPWTATLQGATVDRHVLTVPFAGQAIRALRQPVILNTLMYGAPAVLVVGLLASIWRKDPDPHASE